MNDKEQKVITIKDIVIYIKKTQDQLLHLYFCSFKKILNKIYMKSLLSDSIDS